MKETSLYILTHGAEIRLYTYDIELSILGKHRILAPFLALYSNHATEHYVIYIDKDYSLVKKILAFLNDEDNKAFYNALNILEEEQNIYIEKVKRINSIEKINEAVKGLEENIKEDAYMLNKIEQSLKMGAKAQSLAIVEVYQILKNRNKDNL